MNRIIKKFVIFVLPVLFLFINVSYAVIETGIIYTGNFDVTGDYVTKIGSYSISTLYSNVKKYLGGDEDDLISNMNDLINNQIISKWYVILNSSNSASLIVFPYGIDGEVFYCETADDPIFVCFPEPTTSCHYWQLINSTTCGHRYLKKSDKYCDDIKNLTTVFSPKFSVKSLNKVTEPVSGYQWDGTSYYYKDPSDETDSPTLPTNSQIAQAVQSFYNSDYYKNNKNFKDFIVMYNYNTKYFDFIGHNFENKLGQQIVDAGVSIGSPAISYNERWWRFFLPNELLTTLFNKYYWLYSTNDFGESIEYTGKGAISDLLDLHFSTSSIIVYSTTDYPINTVFKNESDEVLSEADTMPGNQYTYNENLDPTTNEYNPLKDFIPRNPMQNILGNIDFSEINKVFEENKNILNIENASWLFSANNKLVNYFIGFLSFLIVLIIISRLLGG